MYSFFKKVVCVLFLISMLLSLIGCSDKSYQDYDVGENFGHNVDGHFKKLPNNYCLQVDLGTITTVFIIPTDKTDVPFFTNSIYLQNAILTGHYITGWFNDTHLILCEEKNNSERTYLSLEFCSNTIVYYDMEDTIYNEFGFTVQDWFVLCNTYAEIK